MEITHDPSQQLAGVESSDSISYNEFYEVLPVEENLLTNGHTQLGQDSANNYEDGMTGIQRHPFVLPRRTVSGRYRGNSGAWQLELRIDVDGTGPLNRVSGDFNQISGGTTAYHGSFVLASPTITYGATSATIRGYATFGFSIGNRYIRVTVPRNLLFQPAAAATLRFFTNDTSTTPSATYTCALESRFFRTVFYEQDNVSGVAPFTGYNTGTLPSGGPARVLSVASAFAEAGVEMVNTGGTNIVSTASIGSAWSDSELHAAMMANLTGWTNQAQWRVWLLVAQLHDLGTGLYGIMFDQQGKQRQGCAVFNAGIGGTSAQQQRIQLYTYVHELGHCFNLAHSWQKSFNSPAVPNRTGSLSWMNYPWYFLSGGPAGFWAAFPFRFDAEELMHIRHAYRNNVVMGGNNFLVGGALGAGHDHAHDGYMAMVENHSGLELRLEARPSYAFGEPVVVDLRLRTYDLRGKSVHPYLHPSFDLVKIAIQKPDGRVVAFHPLGEHFMAPKEVVLDANNPALYESAYIGFGKDGFYFDQGGFYTLRAVYFATDGSQVVSEPVRLRVKSPVTAAEDDLADLFFGDDQGYLLSLLGSDGAYLRSGNDAFDLVLDKYKNHPMAVYAALVKGINAGREFKALGKEKQMDTRQRDFQENEAQLTKVMEATKKSAGHNLDNISLNMAMINMAKMQKRQGNDEGAKNTVKEMLAYFRKQAIKPIVMEKIEAKAKQDLKETTA